MSDRTRRRPSILVADDDRDTRELYRACFDTSGYQTAEAGSGSQAWAMAVELVPDVLLTDYILPDIDGLTVARRLKADRRTRDVRILMVTGYGAGDLEREAAAAGLDRLLFKPCLPQAVLREVSRVLIRSKSPAVAPARDARPAGAARVRAEFAALPGLVLTAEQIRLVADLEAEICDGVLRALLTEGFLSRTAQGRFIRAGAVKAQ